MVKIWNNYIMSYKQEVEIENWGWFMDFEILFVFSVIFFLVRFFLIFLNSIINWRLSVYIQEFIGNVQIFIYSIIMILLLVFSVLQNGLIKFVIVVIIYVFYIMVRKG